MNRWLAIGLSLVFLLLTTASVLFSDRIRSLNLKNLITPTLAPKSSQITSENFNDVKNDPPRLSVVADKLEIPWGLVFLPNKDILFTERSGRVRLIKENKLQENFVFTIPDIYPSGEGGLLGITIHPQFEKNNFVYLYYSYRDVKGSMKNKVVRYVFDGKLFAGQKIILNNIPGNSNHDGGRIKFGPDGFLYITTGDSQDPSLAQDKSSFAGKILRISGDENNKIEIYSYGHRNPQGLAWDNSGRLWSTEHGRSGILSGYDELNLVEKGKNYGWPTIQGDVKKDGMIAPIINSGATSTWAPAGMAYFNSPRGEAGGSLFFGGLRGQGLYEAVIDGDNISKLRKHFDHELGRIRDVVLGSDDMLYITTSNRDGRGTPSASDDKIYRVNPKKL